MDTSILKRIPVEVRLMIYDYAFVEATIRVTVQTFCDEGYLNETTTVGLTYSNDARLLLSCRAIKCEAEEVLWKTAKYWSRETRPRWASIPPGFVYRIMGPTNLHELANGMSPHVAKHVKHMEGVTIPPSYALPRGKEVMPHLSKFPSLQVLVVKNLLENSFRFGRMSIIILFDGEWITYEKWKARSSAWRYYKGFTRFKIRFDTSTYYPITGLQLVPPKIQDPREFLADRFGMKLGQPDDRALMDTHFITKWAYKDSGVWPPVWSLVWFDLSSGICWMQPKPARGAKANREVIEMLVEEGRKEVARKANQKSNIQEAVDAGEGQDL